MRKRYEEGIKELKESFEKTIKLQQEQIEELKTDFDNYKTEVVQREYLIKTKFKGTIKNKKLLEELKMSRFDCWYSDVGCGIRYNDFRRLEPRCRIMPTGEHSYEDLCKSIFEAKETVCIGVVFNLIKNLEQKQELLDKYKEQ